jgi:PAS domain S-box-containing protein
MSDSLPASSKPVAAPDARYDALVAALPGQAVLLVDTSGTVTRASVAASRLLATADESLAGRKLTDLLPGDLAWRREARREEISLVGPTGRDMPLLMSVAPVRGGGGGRVLVLTDVTDLSRARRALVGTQLRLRALFEQGIGGIAMFDAGGRFLRVNPVFCELLGYPRGELLERSMVDVVAPEYRAQAEGYFEAVRRGLPTTSNEEVLYRRKDGSAVWLQVSAHPITDPFSDQRLVVVEATDVTATRRRKRALQSIAQGLRQPADGDVISWIVTTAAATLEASCVLVSGTDRDGAPTQIARHGTLTWLQDPDATKAAETPCEAVRRGALVYLPTPEAADGRYRELMVRSGIRGYVGVPISVSDGVVGHLAVLDVRPMPADLPVELWSILRTFGERIGAELTRMRFRSRFEQSEEQFRALLESAAEIFMVADPSGRILEVTDPSCSKLEQTREALTAVTLADLDQDNKLAPLMAALVLGRPEVVETRLTVGDSRALPVEITICLVEWAGERVCLTLGRDISERYRLAEARRRFVEDVVMAQEEERSRVALELHDSLGQLLTSLSLQIRSVAGTASEPSVRVIMDKLTRLSERAIAEASSLAHRLRPPALDDLGLEAAIREHVRELTHSHPLRADLHVRGQSKHTRLPPAIETALYRITQEALTNVLKHANARNVSVLIDRRPNAVRLVVEDDGRGMVAQAPKSGPRVGGLGLPGIRERASLLDGDVRIESSPSVGTALYVTIPVPGDV